MKSHIDTEFNPSKKLFDSSRTDHERVKTIDEIIDLLGTSKTEYEAALSISEEEDFQFHLKRPPNSRFVNQDFSEGLLAWVANLDIQPVFDHYKAVVYMSAYLSKCKDECFQAVSQAVKEAFEHNLDNYQQIKSVAHTSVNKRSCIGFILQNFQGIITWPKLNL